MVTREYSQEEKMAYVEEFKMSGMSISKFAEAKDIPNTTLRGWIKQDKNLSFGKIDLKPTLQETTMPTIKKTMVFAMDNIRLELKEGYNKEFLKQIVEVLSNAD